VQPVLLPLLLQQLLPRQTPDEQDEEEEHDPPSDVLGKHSQFVLMYPEEQEVQSPSLSQSVHPALLPLALQQLPPRQTPDEQDEEEEQDPPSAIEQL
jgi:hypothetical protein